MVLTKTPICNFGEKANTFKLKGTDGKIHSLEDHVGKNGLLVMFICNHCPYVKAVIKDISFEVIALEKLGIKSVAIMSNDTKNYPEDSFDNMVLFAKKHNFTFPYVIDSTQEIAKKYNAVCTPDFFGYNENLKLQYRGRFKELKNLKIINNQESDLFSAMKKISETGIGPSEQIPSMGCNIKWIK